MKAELITYGKQEVFGIKLVPETDADRRVNKRFFDGGVKANAISSGAMLDLTFEDMVGVQRAEDRRIVVEKGMIE